MRSATSHTQETEKLCSSIAARQKCDKIVGRLEVTLREIEEERASILEDKVAEKKRLQTHVNAIREKSLQNIKDYKLAVESKIKVVSWSSHARQTKTLEQIRELKRELDGAMSEHVEAETDMRHSNEKMEAEIKVMIDK